MFVCMWGCDGERKRDIGQEPDVLIFSKWPFSERNEWTKLSMPEDDSKMIDFEFALFLFLSFIFHTQIPIQTQRKSSYSAHFSHTHTHSPTHPRTLLNTHIHTHTHPHTPRFFSRLPHSPVVASIHYVMRAMPSI